MFMDMARPAVAIMLAQHYGEPNDHGNKLVGIAETNADATCVLDDTWNTARAGFISAMKHRGYNINDVIYLENENYKRASLCINDPFDGEPTVEEVAVYREDTVIYQYAMHICHDNTTGIDCKCGRCSADELHSQGFSTIAKLENCQKKWIYFWKNPTTEEVAITLEDGTGNCPTRIFKNRIHGNLWFKAHIEPMHGNALIML